MGITAQHTAQGRRQSALLVPVHAKKENEDATLSTKALKLGLQVVAQDMDELDLIEKQQQVVDTRVTARQMHDLHEIGDILNVRVRQAEPELEQTSLAVDAADARTQEAHKEILLAKDYKDAYDKKRWCVLIVIFLMVIAVGLFLYFVVFKK